MIRQLKDYLLDHWEEILPGTGKPKDLSFVVQGSPYYRVPYTKAIVLLFIPGDSHPVLVGKTPDDPKYAWMVEKEAANLSWIHEGPYPEAVKKAVPRPIALQRIGADTVLIETAVTGESMMVDLLRHSEDDKRLRQIYASATDWLLQMRNEEISHSDDAAAQMIELMEKLLGLYDELYSPAGDEKAAVEEAWKAVKPIVGKEVPLVALQGDYWVNNLFWKGGPVLGVVDWEFARPAALPIWDLFQLQFSMGIAGNKHLDLKGMFDTAFFRDNSVGREFKKSLPVYCETYGLEWNPRVIEALFVLWLVETSVRERELLGRSFEADMIRHNNVQVYLDKRRPDWGTFG